MVSLCCTYQDILSFSFVDCLLDAPLGFLQGPASFSNLADLMVEFWSDSFSWLSVAVVLG